jgi:glutamine amidotransferase
MISIINYGLGNVMAFANIYKKLNIPVEIVSSSSELSSAKKILLPGVGSFDWAMTKLNDSGMREMLDQLVLKKKVPVIGICVGMQMMAKTSDEGEMNGLGWINAEVKRLDNSNDTCLPHMGWNNLTSVKKHPLFNNLDSNARFYFLHSYYFDQRDESQVLTKTLYNKSFTSSISHKNIYGVQFHPEKSHKWGVQLLQNFSQINLC